MTSHRNKVFDEKLYKCESDSEKMAEAESILVCWHTFKTSNFPKKNQLRQRVVQYTRTDTSRVIAFSFLHDPFYSYGSWNNGLRVVQFVNCISLERLRVYIYLRRICKSMTRTTRTTRPSRETMVYESYTLCELHIIRGT